MDSFIFGAGTDVATPEALAKKRALIQAIQARNATTTPKNMWEGLNSIADALGTRYQGGKLDKAEAEGLASGQAAYQPVIDALKGGGTPGNDVLVNASASPWLTDPQQDIVKTLLKGNTGEGGEFGLNPIWGTDANGGTVAFQPNKAGGVRPIQFPEGVKPTPGFTYQDMGTFVQPFNSKTGVPGAPMQKDVAGAETEKAKGKGKGEAIVDYGSISSKMPGLELVIADLDKLAEKATYTMGGQVVDFGRRQLGMDPREAAVARAEYISKVDNQILPLLRDTFGAQFTQKEGESLKATLGDPNKSPQEKQAVLRSFIEQKRRDVEALGVRSGEAAPAEGDNAFSTDPQFGQVVNGFKIGKTARNPQTGEVLTWDGNGWRQ